MGLLDFRVCLTTPLGPPDGFQDNRVGLLSPDGLPGGPPDPFWTFGFASQPLSNFRVGLPTPP